MVVGVTIFLRTKRKFCYKISKVEQNGEKLHKDFNDLVSLYKNIKNIIDKTLQSFQKIRKF